MEKQIVDLTDRLCEIETQSLASRENWLKDRGLVLERERVAKRKFTETELENTVWRGQLAVLERVLGKGPCRVMNGQGGQLGGGSADVRDAAGSDGVHQGESVGAGAGAITDSASTSVSVSVSVSVSATNSDTVSSSGSGSLKLGRSGDRLITALLDNDRQIFF